MVDEEGKHARSYQVREQCCKCRIVQILHLLDTMSGGMQLLHPSEGVSVVVGPLH